MGAGGTEDRSGFKWRALNRKVMSKRKRSLLFVYIKYLYIMIIIINIIFIINYYNFNYYYAH